MTQAATTAVTFAIETLDQSLEEGAALLRDHWHEVALFQDLQILDPDYEIYRDAEKKNALIIATARDAQTKKLIGYHVIFLRRGLHYKGVLQAVDDIYYLEPAYRLGWTAVRLIKFAENEARRRGAQLSIARAKAKSQHGALFKRMGYELSDEVFLKRL
jgi:GNAT superfamily N-acetyltransferase